MAISTKMQGIRNLRKSMPQANAQIAQQKQAAADLQMKQAAVGAPATYQAAAQLGAATAGAKAAAGVEAYKDAATADTRMREVELSQAGMEERRDVAGARRGLAERREANLDRVASLGSDIQDRILKDRLQFRTDQSGQKYLNSRQLADFAILKAQTAEQYADYAQTVQQATQKKMAMAETAHKKIMQVLEQEHKWAEWGLDKESAKELAKMARDHQKAMADMQNDAANKGAMWSAGGQIAGTAAGAYFGGPAGAAAGGALGGAAGKAIGGVLG